MLVAITAPINGAASLDGTTLAGARYVSATKEPTNVVTVQTFTGTIRSDRRPGNCNPEGVRNVPAVK